MKQDNKSNEASGAAYAGRVGAARRIPKVMVSVSLTYASWRDFFSGILRYVDERTNWDIRIAKEPGDILAQQIDELEQSGYSGLILATPGRIDFDRLIRSSVPLVTWGGWEQLYARKISVAHIHCDHDGYMKVGARHLMAQGRHSIYGFVRSRFDKEWCRKRQDAFVQMIRTNGGVTACYELPPRAEAGNDITELGCWLAGLPKPAAVMADCDERAAQVISACHARKLRVPLDVAVLGIDNDTFYALHTRPPLSSVVPGHDIIGYRAAAELDRLIRARKVPLVPKHVTVPPQGIVVRESTRPISSAAILVRRAKEFIDANVNKGIKVSDVARHLGCSRRMVELRFRDMQRQTIAGFIADCRLDKVKKRLATSKASVMEIAAEFGFRHPAHLSRLFRQRFGQTIREWRKHVAIR